MSVFFNVDVGNDVLLRKVLAKFQNTATEGKSLFAAISRRGNSLGMIWPGLGISLFIVSNSFLSKFGQIVSNLSIHYVSIHGDH